MRVAKWGNSLAVRIPAAVAEALELREGDNVEITAGGPRELSIERDQSRQKALERIRALRIKLPDDWKFDREEANAR